MVRRFPDNDGLEWYVLTTGYTEVGTVMKWTAQFKLAADDLDNFIYGAIVMPLGANLATLPEENLRQSLRSAIAKPGSVRGQPER